MGSSTPLMEASQEGQIEVVKYLIEKGTFILYGGCNINDNVNNNNNISKSVSIRCAPG